MVWRKELISVLPNRKIVFWRNDDDRITISNDQVIHYWGAQKDCASSMFINIQSPLPHKLKL
jgi:hypothetical protein